MQQEKETFYSIVKESGELFLFFDDMTGVWETDKEEFCTNYDTITDELR